MKKVRLLLLSSIHRIRGPSADSIAAAVDKVSPNSLFLFSARAALNNLPARAEEEQATAAC